MKTSILTGPRNLKLIQKTTLIISTIWTKVSMPELDKKIEQPKKKEKYK
jgi:hypothetical protein